jgi:riboflavin synthase
MFTGIVQSIGKIQKVTKKGDSIRFVVKPGDKHFLKNVKTGDSISINGACMTIENKSKDKFEFTTIKESLSKTNFGNLNTGDSVNLEKSLTLQSKLDGHIVQGHVDATGVIKMINKLKDSHEFFIEFSSKFKKNIIEKGSIAINGISLTIAGIVKETSKNILIKIAIIPFTFSNTNFSELKESDEVNIEFDMIGKYVERMKKVIKF